MKLGMMLEIDETFTTIWLSRSFFCIQLQ